MTASPRKRRIISETSVPLLARQAQLRFDDVRQCWIILAPERVLAPDEIAVEVLHLCDGERSTAMIIDMLCAKYEADRHTIASDVIRMLQDLADKSFLNDRAVLLPAAESDE